MLGLGTYKLLPAGLMQMEQEITIAGQERHSKGCHPMDQSSPAIQLRPGKEDAASQQALASLLRSGLLLLLLPPLPTPVARKPA